MNTPKHVPWWAFATVIAFMFGFGGFLYWQVAGVSFTVSEMKTDLAVVKNDTSWIKQNMNRTSAVSPPR